MNGREARKGQRMTRHKFIKIMQSKGVQRNEAVALAKEVRKYKKRGYNYKNVSEGSVTIYGGGNYIVLLSNYEAIVIGKYLTDKLNYVRAGNKMFRLTKGESK